MGLDSNAVDDLASALLALTEPVEIEYRVAWQTVLNAVSGGSFCCGLLIGRRAGKGEDGGHDSERRK